MQVQEGGIKRLVLLSSTVVITTITVIVSLFLITTENQNFQEEVQRIEEELTVSRKRSLENRLQSILNEITFDQSLMRELQLEEVRSFVRTLQISLSSNLWPNNPTTLRHTLKAHDTDDSIHGFALYEDGSLLWSPKSPESQDQNYLDFKDINGKLYIKEMIEVAKSNHDIPVTFTWYLPGETSISSNIAYVKYIPRLKLIVGAYRSEEAIDAWVQETILRKINNHQFWKESFFFIDFLKSYRMQDDFSSSVLSLGDRPYIDALKEKKTQSLIGKTFLDQGFSGLHVNTYTHQNEHYLLYTTILPKWRWVIGLGENLQELTDIKKAQLSRATVNRDVKIVQLSVLAITIALIFFILSTFLARAIEKLLINYRQKADMEADKYQALYQHSNDSFLLAHEEGNTIIDANPKALSLTALSMKDLLGQPLEKFFPNLEFEEIKKQKSGYERTVFIDNNQEGKTVEFTFVWIYLQDKRVIFVSIRDITERMKLVSERRKQEQLLIQQSKMAAMGEMIGNIAHQWRQPLSQISGLFMDIDSAYTFGDLDQKYMQRTVDEANDIIEYMSRTIDDFRNFFNPNKTKEPFKVSEALNQAIKIINTSLQFHDITLNIKTVDEKDVEGFKNEYAQVILNLLSNAKDILIERDIEDPRIDIVLFTKDAHTCLSIHDNAGGIEPEIIEKVFEPYFTTKYDYGTGVGLYMSKIIIEKNMGGQITVKNKEEGARFTITI